MKHGLRIDYKQLRAIDKEAAQATVLEYLDSNSKNISDAARMFGINRSVVYAIMKKEKEGDLKDRSKTPKPSLNKTSSEIEDRVIDCVCKREVMDECSLLVSVCHIVSTVLWDNNGDCLYC